ncbi:MAG: DUF5908 family protein [bacterium]|jgi:hypothetical protein
MPIEIRELVIRATVEKSESQSDSRAGTQTQEQNGQGVNDCLTKIEEIRKMIQEKNER